MDSSVCSFFTLVLLLVPAAAILMRQQVHADRLALLERKLKALEARGVAPATEPEPERPATRATVAVPPAVRAATPEPSEGRVETPEVAAAPPPPATPVPPRPVAPPRPPAPAWQPPSIERVVVWVAASGGGLMVAVSALFALRVVIERGWLGPGFRVFGGLFAASVMLVVGSFLRSRARVAASGLTGAGAAVAFATLYAAHGMYHLIPGPVAFAALVICSAAASFAADRGRDRLLAGIGLLGGLLTPVLVSTGENRPIGLFAYLAVLSVGQLGVAWRRGWAEIAAGVVLGVGFLYAGWTATWWAPDQVPVALASLLVLTAPWAFAAARATPHTAIRLVAGAATLGLPLLALPWVVPVDPMFSDPGGGGTSMRPFGASMALAALAPAVLLMPAWLAARWRREPWTIAASAVAALLTLSSTVGYSLLPEPQPAWILVGALLPALAAVPFAMGKGLRPVLAPVVGVGGLALAVASAGVPLPAGLFFAAVVLLAALTTLGSADFVVVAAGLAGLALATGIAATSEEVAPVAVLGAAAAALGLLGTAPLLHRGSKPGSTPIHVLAALAGPALLPALYLAWRAEWGTAFLGPVPLVVGLAATLSALVMLRVHRADANDLGLAVAAAVAVGGVTAALPAQLETSWLTVAWSLEAAALAWLYARLRHPVIPIGAVLLSIAVSARLLMNPWVFEYGDTSGFFLLNWPLYTWGIPFVALLVASAGLRHNGRTPAWANTAVPVLLLAFAVGFALVNVEVSDLFQDAGPLELGGASLWQGMVRSLAWAAYGMAILVAGLAGTSRMVRLVGFSFILLAALKVGIYDVWTLRGFVRVGSLLGLGVALLLAALLFEWLVIRGGRQKEEKS